MSKQTASLRKHGALLEETFPCFRGASVVPWLQGQVTLEYFILFAVVALVTVIGVTTFDSDLRASLEDFVSAAATKIAREQVPE